MFIGRYIVAKSPQQFIMTTTNISLRGLEDSEPIAPENARQHGVVISVPLIYVNTEDDGLDEVVSNLRTIHYEPISELMGLAISIFESDKDGQTQIGSRLSDRLSKTMPDTDGFVDIISWGASASKDLDVTDEYDDAESCGVSFDVIKMFVVDTTTGVLQYATPTPVHTSQLSPYVSHDLVGGEIHLYSQLGENEAAINFIREKNNDTDFNRLQYYLAHFTKQLTFAPGYVINQTSKMINLALFFLCVYAESRPILGYCSNDLISNMLGFIVDVAIRTRVTQAWRRGKDTSLLLRDLSRNYDANNYAVKISKLPTARARASCFLKDVKDKQAAKLLNIEFFDKYMDLISRHSLPIANSRYYLFNSEFLAEFSTMLPDDLFELLATIKDE